jgi:hypothetical protein
LGDDVSLRQRTPSPFGAGSLTGASAKSIRLDRAPTLSPSSAPSSSHPGDPSAANGASASSQGDKQLASEIAAAFKEFGFDKL